MGFSDVRLARSPARPRRRCARRGRRHRPGLQARRHLLGRVRVAHALPLLDLRARVRGGPTERRKVVILGSGPNRIGQGIEFDYCCCHAAFAFKEEGFETIMVNCNPETVSTDYDTSDRLYFEPLTFEDVMNVRRAGEARGRGDPVRRADAAAAGRCRCTRPASRSSAPAPTRSTSPEDRKRFSALLDELDITQPESGTATSLEEAKVVADAHRLPGAGAAVVRARRARDGDRLRRGPPRGATCARP